MEPSLFSKTEQQEREIPIIIRSHNDGFHILDIMQLQNLELKVLPQQITNMYSFITDPFALSGCNLGIVGQHQGTSLI